MAVRGQSKSMRNCLVVGSTKLERDGKLRMTLAGRRPVDDMKAVDTKTVDTKAGTDAGTIELGKMDFCRPRSSESQMTGKGCSVNCNLSCKRGTASSSRSMGEENFN